MKIKILKNYTGRGAKIGNIYVVGEIGVSMKTGKRTYITKRNGYWIKEDECEIVG